MITDTPEGIVVDVLVQPRASRAKLGPVHDGRIKISVTAPPVDGEANAAVIETVAKALAVPRSAVAVVAGMTSRRKTLRITGASRAALLAVLLVAGCDAGSGTMQLELVTAPDSQLLASVDSVRVTVTTPPAVYEATRGADGISLAFELEATDELGPLYVEAFAADEVLLASGQTPELALSGTNSTVRIYVAPPYAIEEAPLRLPALRSHMSATALPYGAIVVGGRDGDGATVSTVGVYNAYNHGFSAGLQLPAPRADVALATTSAAHVYIVGGTDTAGAAQSTVYRFQTNVAPSGAYVDSGAAPGLESAGARAVALGDDTYLVTGPRPAILAADALTARADLPALPATAVSIGSAAVALRDGFVDVVTAAAVTASIPLPVLDRAVIAARPDGTAVVLGGGTDAYVVDPVAATAMLRAAALSTPRFAPSIAHTARHIVVAGGVDADGTAIASADILDATTLALLRTVPITARIGAQAVALPNGQVMLVGGDAPTDLIELFTPPLP